MAINRQVGSDGMRVLVAVLLVAQSLVAGCISFAKDAPTSLELPTLAVDGVAVDFLGCAPPQEHWRPSSSAGVCHVAQLRLAVPPGAPDAATHDGWTAVTDQGGVYEGRLLSGPSAVVSSAQGRVRLAFQVDDGGSLAQVRWGGPANLTVTAPVGTYVDLSTIGPRLTFLGAERSHFDCEAAWIWPCTVATLAVDNAAGDAAFPSDDLQWIARHGDFGGGDVPITAGSQVAAGEAGEVRLVLPSYMPAMNVGFRMDGWSVPAFDLPAYETLPLADHGAQMETINLAPLREPYHDADGLLQLWVAAGPTTSTGICTPFAGTVSYELHWHPGPLTLDALWMERATGSGPVTPDTFTPEDPWCALELGLGMQDEDVSGVYRLRVTASVDATGKTFAAETFFWT